MKRFLKATCLSAIGLATLAGCANQPPGPQNMTFFVTSVGPGKGGDLGGLEGADRHCQALATAAGAGARTWHAYLSTQAPKLDDPNFVNARDRIGSGPWHNAKGELIARNVEELLPGYWVLAAAVVGQDDRLAAALSITLPLSELTPERETAIAALLKDAARKASLQLGHSGNFPGILSWP